MHYFQIILHWIPNELCFNYKPYVCGAVTHSISDISELGQEWPVILNN